MPPGPTTYNRACVYASHECLDNMLPFLKSAVQPFCAGQINSKCILIHTYSTYQSSRPCNTPSPPHLYWPNRLNLCLKAPNSSPNKPQITASSGESCDAISRITVENIDYRYG